MILPISIAQKLQQMLLQNISFPASALKHAVIDRMILDGILQKRLSGKSKAVIFNNNPIAFHTYLKNQFGIIDLDEYITVYQNEGITRSDAVQVSGNSKLKPVRTFKGFLVNCYEPIGATLNGNAITINPFPGSLVFISDYESFYPDASVTIVGIENPENFRQVHKQQYLFTGIKPLFISRYPQSNDAIKWLQSIPNNYLHFGDLDFSGVNIFLREYKKWLGSRASFFIPPNIPDFLKLYGNRELYNRQLHLAPKENHFEEQELKDLINLLHHHKNVLEQEVYIPNS